MRADLAIVVLILIVPDGLVGKDNEGGHPGHSLPGGHDHLDFIIALSWQPWGCACKIYTKFPFRGLTLCPFELWSGPN